MASKEVADLTARVLDGTEEFHLVAGIVRDGGGVVTNHGNSRRATLATISAYVLAGAPAGGISQAFADGRYLQKANNLSDVASAAPARGNLSVYSIAQVDALIAGVGTGPVLESAVTKPAVAGFTLRSGASTGCSITNKSFGVELYRDGTANGQFAMAVWNVVPNTAGGFTLTARMTPTDPGNGTSGYDCSLIIRNSTNGRFLVFTNYSSAANILIQQWASTAGNDIGLGGTFNGTLCNFAYSGNMALFPWRRITVDAAGNVKFFVSPDGDVWREVTNTGTASATTLATWLTAAGGGTVDQVGFGGCFSRSGTLCQHFSLV